MAILTVNDRDMLNEDGRQQQADTPPTEEWRQLAAHKLEEVEQLLARTQAMRALLHTWLHCDCLTLDDIDAFRQANADWAHAQQQTGD